jgi:radical SAM superfamily enzyme YgiQ (UPF0313 family)
MKRKVPKDDNYSMKKILLVNTNTEVKPYPVPPLGLCLIASVLAEEYEVFIYDSVIDRGKSLPAAVMDFRPDYVGLSIRNIDDMNILKPTNYTDEIRNAFLQPLRESTSAPIILGGSAFSILPEFFMGRFGADYGIFGEGESAFPQLLACLERGGDPGGVPGVVVRDRAGDCRQGDYFDLAGLPFSEIDLKLDYAPYRARGAYPVQTKRGCSHRCIYCTYNCIEGYRYRTRPPEHIADEIEQAAGRLGDITFEFVDSTFNDPPGHAESICREIARRGLSPRLRTMGINPSNATRELFDLMIAAGFAQIDCTPDTASPRMLANMGKNFTLDQLRSTARIVREFDIPTMWFFIFGGPGETGDTVRETFDFIDTHISGKDMVHMTCGLRIYPGTGLYRRAIEDGTLAPDDPASDTRFYISRELGMERLFDMIREASLQRPNCVPVMETEPSPEMMREAMETRREQGLTEPMFRTLLRIRYRMFGREMAR